MRRALRDPRTTVDDLRRALRDHDPAVRRAVLDHRLCPDQWRRDAVAHDPDPDVCAVGVLTLGAYARLPEGVDRSPHKEVRRAVAGLPDCPPEVLRRLALDEPSFAVRGVALPRVLDREPDRVWDVMYGVYTPDATLVLDRLGVWERDAARAAGIPHRTVREALAQRPTSPVGLLERLGLHDSSSGVRSRAVANAGFPSRSLARAFEDTDADVRAAAVERPDFPQGLLDRAAHDPSDLVREAALLHKNLPAQAVGRLASWREERVRIRIRALEHGNCPMEAITNACMSHIHKVRLAALSQPRPLPPDIVLYHLARASRPTSSNRRAPRDQQQAAIRDAAVAQLNKYPWSVVRDLPLEELPLPALQDAITGHLDEAVRDPRTALRLAAAQHPEIGAELLARLGRDTDERVRRAAGERILIAL